MSRVTLKKYLPPCFLLLAAFIFGISFSAQKSAA